MNTVGGQKNKNETVRVKLPRLDELMSLVSELVLVRNQHLQQFTSLDETSTALMQRLNSVTTELHHAIMQVRMQPIGVVFSKLPFIARDLSRKLKKNIAIKITGDDVEIDKTILEALTDPLTHTSATVVIMV
jgi:two-component system chemotaxis sensor kinase CheA